jgi:hypothetical protein
VAAVITVTCNKCSRTLELDDAFAGGVCRCGTCGSIQHVPSELKPATAGPVQIPMAGEPATAEIPPATTPSGLSTHFIIALGAIVLLIIAIIIALWKIR